MSFQKMCSIPKVLCGVGPEVPFDHVDGMVSGWRKAGEKNSTPLMSGKFAAI